MSFASVNIEKQARKSIQIIELIKVFLRKTSTLQYKGIRRVKNIFLTARIRLKWQFDSRKLPLTHDHWELYAICHKKYWEELHDFPDLRFPRDFNDRIQWLKLFDQSEEIIRCSDKIQVRDRIRERVGEKYLVQLYQTCERFDEIKFDSLPKAFVIKTNHDSGTVILVRDKNKLDREAARQKIEASLYRTYGWENGEWAYAFVKPRVLVEAFIRPQADTPPPDYKFQCVEGTVKFCRYTYDRGFDTKEIVVNRNGHAWDLIIDENFKRGSGFRRPEKWLQMVELAEKLSAGFKCVRVDLYEDDKNLYIGEMTFFPYMGTYKGEGQKMVGPLLDFNQTTFNPPIYHKLKRPIPVGTGA